MSTKHAIIIGSGIAGMATAIRLASAGYQISVFESNESPGGKLSYFEKEGFKFDEGPSLFTQPQNIEELFAFANEPIEKYFNYSKTDVACNYFFENGKKIAAYTDKKRLSAELADKLNEDSSAVEKYLSDAERLYNKIGLIFLNHSLHKLSTWLHKRVLHALSVLKTTYLFNTLHHHNNKRFISNEAVQIFNRFATYNGSNPYKAPGMLSLIPHLEHNQGTFYPKGGMISITNALYKLAIKKGVQFNFNQSVEKIIQEDKKVKGVVVNGEHVFSDLIISNADVYHTYNNLLNHLPKATKLAKQERSSSALIFYWGINKQFDELGLHNILFSNHYKEEFDCLFNKKTILNDPTIYINITSKMEKEQAPTGSENWFVMINAPTNNGQDWDALIKETRKNVIQKINRILNIDIEQLIKTETILDPRSIEKKTGTYKGSLYGTSSNSPFSAFLRPANFASNIKGLYFCGGTVHPGGGIPLCLKSAYITSELIIKNEK